MVRSFPSRKDRKGLGKSRLKKKQGNQRPGHTQLSGRLSTLLLETDEQMDMTLGALLEGVDFQLSSGRICLSYRAVRAPLDLSYRLE